MQPLQYRNVSRINKTGPRRVLQSAQSEYRNQADFLLPGKLKVLQNRHRQKPNGQVGDDIKGRKAEPESQQVDAVAALDTFVPVISNRPA